MKFNHAIGAIGKTPMVKIKKLNPNPRVEIFAKLEGGNPGGSVKDRVAKMMIEEAERKGLLGKEKTIIEATSGNTGIGLAMITALKGYRFIAVLPGSVSLERKNILKAYGAKIVLSPSGEGTNGAIKLAKKMLKENLSYLMLDQFNNPANVLAHFLTTGQEIIDDLPAVDAFVAGMGTGGTLMGVGQRLRKANPGIKIIGVEPYPNSKILGLRNMQAYTPSIYAPSKIDSKIMVKDKVAFDLASQLFSKEGLSVGISSGAALWGAIELAKKMRKGVIVTIFPDRGDRYLSTRLFR
ncbi:PLP-dependent cysteine synthase family protein [Patescibacteria group bacterium]